MNTIEFVIQPESRSVDVDFTTLKHLRSIQAPFVFIGLGGGGSTAVSMLKTLFDQTFSSHVPEHQPGISPSFQFLAFDSDAARPSNLEPGREWIQLDGQGLGHGAWDRYRRDPHYSQWLASGVSYADFATGCQGYRNLGKFLFQKNISEVHSAIRGAESRARSNPATERGSKITFVLFCTLAGGTGSGCLLDCAFLLRAMFPDFTSMRLWSFLACAEGFSGNTILDARAKTGTYAALREIDHFMHSGRREALIDALENANDPRNGYLGLRNGASRGTFRFPGGAGIQGRYEKPFDWAFLLGHDNAKGIKLAEQSSKLSAMMARFAFSLCAYPVPEANEEIERGQTFAANANNISDQLSLPNPRGASVCYMVPGLAAAHLPGAQAFDLMAIQSARVMLETMLHGSADPTHMDEAKAFVEERLLTTENVSAYLQDKIERITGDTIQSTAIQSARKVLETNKRYNKKTSILRLINDYLEIGNFQNRVADRKKRIWKEELDPKLIVRDEEGKRDLQQSPYTVAESLAEFEQSILDHCDRELRTESRRRVAVEDFLGDLSIVIDDLVRRSQTRAHASASTHQGQCRFWESGKNDSTSARGILENFVTKNGSIFDYPDILLRGTVLKDYEANCEAAFNTYRDRLRDELAVAYARELAARVAAVRQRLDAYFAACRAADGILARVESELIGDLFEQEEGRGGTLATAFSFSLMPAAWQASFREDRRLDDPATVQHMIEQTAKGDWRPLSVIGRQASLEANPSRKPLGDWIAQDLCDHLFAQLQPLQREYSRWKDGEGIKRTLEVQLPGERPGDGFERAGLLLDQKCAPQWDTSQNATTLGQNVQSIRIFAGPPEVTAVIKREANLRGDVNNLLTYEADRITMITFAYPIGLAGCGRVYSPLKAAYDQAISTARNMDKASGRHGEPERLFHCFPRSWEWPDPTELTSEEDAYLPEFTTCLLLGRLHRLEECPAAYRDLVTGNVLPAMDRAASSPREKAPGLFTPDGSAWYLTPFVSIDPAGKRETAFEPPVKLGGDLISAFERFTSTPANLDQGRGWTEWWKEHRTHWLGSAEISDILEALSDWARTQRDRHQPTTRDYRIWDKVRRHFDGTRQSLA